MPFNGKFICNLVTFYFNFKSNGHPKYQNSICNYKDNNNKDKIWDNQTKKERDLAHTNKQRSKKKKKRNL